MLQFEFPYPKRVKSKSGGTVEFDPVRNTGHRVALDRQIANWKAKHPEAATATLDHIDEARRVAVLIDKSVTTVTANDDGALVVNLSVDQMKPSKGQEVRAWYEKERPGYYMTIFRPFAGKAVFEKLTDAQRMVRSQIAAALGLPEWDIRVQPADDKGWLVQLDESLVYQPAKMDSKLEDACHAIGGLGWWFEANAKTGRISIHPGEPPTFLKSHPYPYDMLGDPKYRDLTPFAVKLPKAGGMGWDTAFVDWRESAFVICGGEPGSGKSVFLNGMLANIISQKPELSILDLKNKSTDYYWCRPWVTPGHWGCESVVKSAGVLNRLVHEIEHGERAKAWTENAWQSWFDIPAWAKEKFPLHYIIIDEYSSLVDKAKDVARLPDPSKILPSVIEKQYQGQAEADIKSAVMRLLRTARAQGYRLILVSQTINERSGLGPTTRDLFGHHIVMGPNPSEALVKSTFHDPNSVQAIPSYLFDQGVTKGLGRAELQGERGFVFKTCYAGADGHTDTEMLGKALVDIVGLPDGVDRDKYLDTLRKHGEDNPVDGAFMNMLTKRIDISERDALKSDPILDALKQALDDSRETFGGGSDDAPTKDDDANTASPSDSSKSKADSGPRPADSGLTDARELARIMSRG